MQVLRYPNIFAKLCVCCEQFVNVPGLFQLFDRIFHKCPQKPVKMPSLPEFMALGHRHLVAAVIKFVLRIALAVCPMRDLIDVVSDGGQLPQ